MDVYRPRCKLLSPTFLRRVIETWFDPEYKEFFYTREPVARYVDMGDISEQVRT